MTLLALIIWIVILGVIAYLVRIAPFIDATFKSAIVFILIVVAAVIVIKFLLVALGGSGLNLGSGF